MNDYNPATMAQQPAAICALKSPADAIFILEAVRAGKVPRVTRRLTGHERASIKPGTVWVWEEEETNMRRWTDGRRWGASRVGGGGFLVYTESSESHSPPPNQSNPYSASYYQPPRRGEGLIKQTYSTSMRTSTGKPKRFHVVAYSSKFNPQGEAHAPLLLPHELPALKDITIHPANWPEWEQQRNTTEAYARRPPPGVTISSANASAPPLPIDSAPTAAYPPRMPTPPTSKDVLPSPGYPNGSYLPRDTYDRRTAPQYLPQPSYGSERYPPYYDGRQPNRSPYSVSETPPYPGVAPAAPADGYYSGRRDRSPPPRDGVPSVYVQTPYPYYGNNPARGDDRYPETSPSYAPYGQQVDYRSPELRSYDPIDTKPNSTLLLQPNAMGRLPPTPNSAHSVNPDLPNMGPSPKLSISNNLLNPSDQNGTNDYGAPGGQSAPGLTLPPLRMTLDDGATNGVNGGKSPNGMNEMLPTEDARQLDGLGRRVY